MSERPILFSAPMVRAILDGRKTQTRRVVKSSGLRAAGMPAHAQFADCSAADGKWRYADVHDGMVDFPRQPACPYGAPGDRLWVRETFAHWSPKIIWYAADCAMSDGINRPHYTPGRRRPSIHMPRWASRITLEVTGVRVERLQEVSQADCVAEGIPESTNGYLHHVVADYRKLWSSINGAESWAANPWVWCISFRRVI
jgi:hypothetical protein